MKIRLLQLLSLIFLAGCADLDPAIPCELEQSTQTGIYSLTTEEVSGDCGDMGSLEWKVDNGVPLMDDGVGCVVDSTQWNDCSTVTRFVCDDGAWTMDLEWTVTSDPENPDRLSGSLIAHMEKWAGIYTCDSGYTFEAEKNEEEE